MAEQTKTVELISYPLIDMSLGISDQAYMVLHALNYRGLQTKDFAHTSAWYNGRERGFVISVQRISANKQLNITFGECRNSDEIFVDHWYRNTFNPPTVMDFVDEDYQSRKYFKCMDVKSVVEYIQELLVGYVVE